MMRPRAHLPRCWFFESYVKDVPGKFGTSSVCSLPGESLPERKVSPLNEEVVSCLPQSYVFQKVVSKRYQPLLYQGNHILPDRCVFSKNKKCRLQT